MVLILGALGSCGHCPWKNDHTTTCHIVLGSFLDPLKSILVSLSPDWEPLDQKRLVHLRCLRILAHLGLSGMGIYERRCLHYFYWVPTMCQVLI